MQTPQPFACPRIGVAISTIFVLIPARAKATNEPAMTEYIDGAGHLCQQRGVAITVACHHLANTHTFGIASQGGRADPAFKSHFLCGRGNRMEMIVEPDRVKAQSFRFLRDAR